MNAKRSERKYILAFHLTSQQIASCSNLLAYNLFLVPAQVTYRICV